MKTDINNIVIVGGGTAGWLTAGVIAAHCRNVQRDICITLIESPDIATIGVGEGTWPSMRETLRKIGISESVFITECDASFKQASQFIDWCKTPQNTQPHNQDNQHSDTQAQKAQSSDSYYHPFSMPLFSDNTALMNRFVSNGYLLNDSLSNDCLLDNGITNSDVFDNGGSIRSNQIPPKVFSEALTYQHTLCQHNLAPKLISTPEYQFIGNYGYHLDAGKFSKLLKRHCIEQLQVVFVSKNVSLVHNNTDGYIDYLVTDSAMRIEGDLFIDCSGSHGVLIDKHFGVPLISKKNILFNDSALAVQIPYSSSEEDICSSTKSTAQSCGWVWDIGLQSRRGIGLVYASDYTNDQQARHVLDDYLAANTQLTTTQREKLSIKKLTFTPGYRQTFWHKNCVAVGMASGFIEPLEASALALIEQSATMIAEQLPANNQMMNIVAARFNQRMHIHWEQIIHFLKLHYVLSTRDDSAYWVNHRHGDSIPLTVAEWLTLWQYRAPDKSDIQHSMALFSAASYQYIFYGMASRGMHLKVASSDSSALSISMLDKDLLDIKSKQQQLKQKMPTNRQLLNKIAQFGLPTI